MNNDITERETIVINKFYKFLNKNNLRAEFEEFLSEELISLDEQEKQIDKYFKSNSTKRFIYDIKYVADNDKYSTQNIIHNTRHIFFSGYMLACAVNGLLYLIFTLIWGK